MTRPSLRVVGLLAAFLIVGLALGFMSGTYYGAHHSDKTGGHHGGKSSIIERLEHELRLTPDQRVKVQEILERNFSALKARRSEARKEMKISREATQREIEAVLNPEQQEKYRKIVERMQSRRDRADSNRADSTRTGRDH